MCLLIQGFIVEFALSFRDYSGFGYFLACDAGVQIGHRLLNNGETATTLHILAID